MIVVRAVKAKAFQSSVFREEMVVASKSVLQESLDDFKRTVQTWKDKPKFSSRVDQGAAVGGVRFQIGTDDVIYGFIDEGTKVRYATMSKDWVSKTEPGVIQAFHGAGRKLFVNKKYPRPGIKARKFTKIIAKSTRARMEPALRNALARAARRSGHGAK